MSPDHIRSFLYPVVGRLLHLAGALNSDLFRRRRRTGGFVKRCWSYLRSFYDSQQVVESALRLPEVDAWMYCDLKDWLIRPYVYGNQSIYEWPSIAHARALVRPGDVFVDIGANHGYWSVCLGTAAGPRGRVIAIEANSVLSTRLERTARLNKASMRMTAVPKAIGDGSQDEIRFYLPTADNSGTGSTVLHGYATQHGYLDASRCTVVPCVSLDKLVAELGLGRMDVVKIDVEFGEDAVIRGARSTLARFRPKLVVCETAPHSSAFRELVAMGYEPYLIDESGQRCTPIEESYWGNVFFRRIDRVGTASAS